jgi:hypothetical protein
MTATPDIIPSDLTLEIDANLSPEAFITAARAFFGYVQEIAVSLSPEGEEPKWNVRVREGSTLLAVDPVPSTPLPVIQAVYSKAATGVDCLTKGKIEESGLSEAALKHLKILSEFGERDKTDPKPLRLWVNKKPLSVVPQIADAIREDWRSDYTDYGTIEGRLETIGDKDGQIRLQIRDAMFKQTVRCYVPEELLPEAFASFRKRVEVSGELHYRHNGTPISIQARHICQLPEDSELPGIQDVRGILSGHA